MQKETKTSQEDLDATIAELQDSKVSESDDGETSKLKRSILLFKKKYQQALQELANKEQLQGQDAAELAKKYREAQEDNGSLIEQQKTLKVLLEKSQEENRRLSEQLQGLKNVSEASQQFEKEVEALKTTEQNFAQEKEELLKKLEEVHTHARQQERAVEFMRAKKEEAELNAAAMQADFEKQLKEALDKQENAEKELESMKQTFIQGLRETKEMKQYYQTLTNEKYAAIQRTTQVQQQVQELKQELKGREQELQAERRRLDEAARQKQKDEAKLREQEQDLREREENIKLLAEQIKVIQGKVKTAEEAARKKDATVLEAQQHLAKKVKESSRLNEILEEKERLAAKLREDLIEAKAKISESHVTFETHREQQKKQQDQITAWEAKYFRVYERLQEVEAQNKELKKVEEKHEQLNQLLGNLGTVLGNPVGLTQPQNIVPQPKKTLPQKEKPKSFKPGETKEKTPLPEEPTLFDPPKPPQSFKNDLFG